MVKAHTLQMRKNDNCEQTLNLCKLWHFGFWQNGRAHTNIASTFVRYVWAAWNIPDSKALAFACCE